MRSVCFYFQVHQPFRLKTYRFFEMGVDHHYFDDFQNRMIFKRVAEKCYLPANKLMLKLIKKHGKDFNIAYSISGLALEQMEQYAPEVIDSFKELAASDNVEFLAESYAHSLASLGMNDEFRRQVDQHREKIKELFNQDPVTFRNTELIYSDDIGNQVYDMGFRGMLTEGPKHILGWKSPNFLYRHAEHPDLKLMLKNYSLSDDIAFRFSDQSWAEWPLTAPRFAQWLNDIDPKEPLVNLFMDYETFGEHQWEQTGIFKFMEALPEEVLNHTDFKFRKPKDILRDLEPVSEIHVPHAISWADVERDLTAWKGNEMQDEAFDKLYKVKEKIKTCKDKAILNDWNYLQASDHFYYMCTKWFSDGDVHRYFNPYPSPYEAFINYMNVLSDFLIRIDKNCTSIPDDNLSEKAAAVVNDVKQKASQAGSKVRDGVNKKWDELKDVSLDDVAKLSNAKIKQLVKKIDMSELAVVLKDADKEVREKIVPNMTITARKQLDKLEAELVKVKKADLKKFTSKIETELRNLWKK